MLSRRRAFLAIVPRRSSFVRLPVAAALTLGALVAMAGSAIAGDDTAEGRKHAQRASHLAASGKCRQALPEFDKAIAVLRDPTLLFNRGECHRKLGDAEAALEDYTQFLSELPNAPNRAQVEERMAELRRAPSGPEATSPDRAGGAVPDDGGSARPPSSPSPPAPAVPTRGSVAAGPVPGPGPTPAVPAEAMLSAAPASPTPAGRSGESLTSSPVFWVAVAAVVVGAALGAYFVLGQDPTNVPRTDLGNYRF